MLNFDSCPCMSDYPLFPGKNSPNRAKGNHIFPGKGRGDRPLILPYLDSQMAIVLLENIYVFILATFRRKQGVEMGQILGTSRFCKNLFFLKICRKLFFSALILPLEKISGKLNNIWWSKGPKKPKKGHFMYAESVQETF